MKYIESKHFADSMMVEVWDHEADGDQKYRLFGRYCWNRKYTDDTCQFYINKEKWNRLIKTKSMFKWILIG
jgi:hypothetical protein